MNGGGSSYPGATEEICIPVLEQESGLKWKQDFFVGYSPERINPGDRERIYLAPGVLPGANLDPINDKAQAMIDAHTPRQLEETGRAQPIDHLADQQAKGAGPTPGQQVVGQTTEVMNPALRPGQGFNDVIIPLPVDPGQQVL